MEIERRNSAQLYYKLPTYHKYGILEEHTVLQEWHENDFIRITHVPFLRVWGYCVPHLRQAHSYKK